MEWISVNYSLPDSDNPYLVIDKWGYMAVLGFDGEKWYPKLDGIYPNFDSDTYTYWSQLPPKPKQ